MVYLWKMIIVHSYVEIPDGKCEATPKTWKSEVSEILLE